MRDFCRRASFAPDSGAMGQAELVRLRIWTCCGQAERRHHEGEQDVSVGAADACCAPLELVGKQVVELEKWAAAELLERSEASQTACALAHACLTTVTELRRLVLGCELASVLRLVEETRQVKEVFVCSLFCC